MQHQIRRTPLSLVRRLPLLALLLLLWGEGVMADPLIVGIRGHRVQEDTFSLFASPGEDVRLNMVCHVDARGFRARW